MESESAKRLQQILDYLKLKPSELSTDLGYDRPQKIYNILKGRNEISRVVAEDITNKYPLLNLSWVFKGQGEMLRPKENFASDNQESYGSDTFARPANVNEPPETLMKKIRERDTVIEGQKNIIEVLKKELLSKEELLKAKDEIIELLKKK